MVKKNKKTKKEPVKPLTESLLSLAESDDDETVENFASDNGSDVYEDAEKLYDLIVKSYENRQEANESISDYWNIYNAIPDGNQGYEGNNTGYIPAVRDAVNARVKRTLKQLFQSGHRHVEAIGKDAQTPYTQLALMEHYIRKIGLKDTVRSDLLAGDVTGQWNLYIDWTKSYRKISGLVKRNKPLEMSGEELEISDPIEEEESIEDEEIIEEGPSVVDFATEDLAVVPPTVKNLEDAEVTAIVLRMSKAKVTQMVDEGLFILPDDTEIKDWIEGKDGSDTGRRNPNTGKSRSADAGIKTQGTYKYAMIYEAHAKLDFGDGQKQMAYIYYAGENEVLGIIKAPQWGGKRPILSAPVDRIAGSFHGISKIETVKYLQWQLNDYWSMGLDSAQYSMMPIVMTDPLKNPNYAAMVIGLAAVWPVDPNSTAFHAFPALWKDAAQMCDTLKRQIWESMDVNEMMMGRMPAGRKNNQLMGAMQQEQSTNITDHAERYEEVMLNPLMERIFEYDAQFRTKELTIVTQGEIGVRASMQVIEPQQWGERYQFRWVGTSMMLGMQRIQQQIATMNVLRGIPPEQLNGRKLDVCPILESITENVFGPEVAPRVLIDDRNQFTIDPEIENELMHNGMLVEGHSADQHIEHLQSHAEAAKNTGDPTAMFRAHMKWHMDQLQKQRQMMMAAQQPKGVPGAPGGQPQPGMAGTPRIGAQPGQQRPMQNPPGAIHADQMADPSVGGRG